MLKLRILEAKHSILQQDLHVLSGKNSVPSSFSWKPGALKPYTRMHPKAIGILSDLVPWKYTINTNMVG